MSCRFNWLLWKHLMTSRRFERYPAPLAKHRLASTSSRAAKLPHSPVLLSETIYALQQIEPLKTVIDMTFGAGGHTREILSNFDDCHVIALDRDEEANQMAQRLSVEYDGRVTPLLGKFSELDQLLREQNWRKGSIDAILIDAGCSSMQFDSPGRGFSLSKDGPLDMRMDGDENPDQLTAADVVNYLDRSELANIFRQYGDEKKADEIAQSIVENRPFHRTKELAAAVGNAVSLFDHSVRMDSLGRRSHVATKTFMALRIFVNDEMNELHAALQCAERYLRHDGRLLTITFHSLEDKLVRTFVKRGGSSGSSRKRSPNPTSPFVFEKNLMSASTPEEILLNPRARSGILRVATRCRSK